jgi:hypothetical protein
MLKIKILGPDCADRQRLAYRSEYAAAALKMEAQIEALTDPLEIRKYPLMYTPGLVINERLVSSGRVPTDTEIAKWLQASSRSRE